MTPSEIHLKKVCNALDDFGLALDQTSGEMKTGMLRIKAIAEQYIKIADENLKWQDENNEED